MPETAIYARISLDRSDGEGVARQLKDCRALARQKGLTGVEEYVDNDVSAFRRKRRPEWDRLITDLRSGRIGTLIAYHPDRLYRSLGDLEDLIDACAGVEVFTTKAGEVDLSHASGRMVARILGATARHESERIGERVSRAKQERAQQGRPAGGGLRPTGLTADRTALHPQEAPMLAQVAANIVGGASWSGEVDRLNQAGHRSSTGKAWTVGTLRRTLTSPYVAGLRAYKGEIVGPGSWPPILDRDTWDALRTTTAARRRGPRPAGEHLLTGHIRCGRCGRRMYGNASSTGWTYRCPPQATTSGRGCGLSIVRDRTDRFVLAEVTDWLTQPGTLKALNRHLSRGADTEGLRAELDTVEQRLTDLARRWAAGDLVEIEHAAARRELVARRDELSSGLRATGTAPAITADQFAEAWSMALEDPDELPALRMLLVVVAAPVQITERVDRRQPVEDRVLVTPAWD